MADSAAAITSCLNHSLEANGLGRRPPEELEKLIGPPLPIALADALGLPHDAPEIPELVASYRALYAEVSLTDTHPFPGIPEVLAELAGHHRLAVATSKPLKYAEPIVAAMGLRGHFAVVAGPGLDERHDPKPAIIRSALEQLGRPERAVMIGDRHYDIDGAHDNGIPAIGVAWGYGSPAELAHAEAFAEGPADLLGLLAELFG